MSYFYTKIISERPLCRADIEALIKNFENEKFPTYNELLTLSPENLAELFICLNSDTKIMQILAKINKIAHNNIARALLVLEKKNITLYHFVSLKIDKEIGSESISVHRNKLIEIKGLYLKFKEATQG